MLPAKKNEVERRKTELRPPWCERCQKPVDYFTVTPHAHEVRITPMKDWYDPSNILHIHGRTTYKVECHGETIEGVLEPDGTLRQTGYTVNFDEWGTNANPRK